MTYLSVKGRPGVPTKCPLLFLNLTIAYISVVTGLSTGWHVIMCEYLLRISLVPSAQILYYSEEITTNINTENTKLKEHNFDKHYESEECCGLRESNKINVLYMGLECPAKSKA